MTRFSTTALRDKFVSSSSPIDLTEDGEDVEDSSRPKAPSLGDTIIGTVGYEGDVGFIFSTF